MAVGLNNITDGVLKVAYVAEQRTMGRKLQDGDSAAKRASKIDGDSQTGSYRDDKTRYPR